MTGHDRDSLIEFPCDFTFKAFGRGDDADKFAKAVQAAVSSVVPIGLDAMKVRPSSKGHFLCVSVLVLLRDHDQLLQIYAALRQVEGLCYLL